MQVFFDGIECGGGLGERVILADGEVAAKAVVHPGDLPFGQSSFESARRYADVALRVPD